MNQATAANAKPTANGQSQRAAPTAKGEGIGGRLPDNNNGEGRRLLNESGRQRPTANAPRLNESGGGKYQEGRRRAYREGIGRAVWYKGQRRRLPESGRPTQRQRPKPKPKANARAV